MLDEYSISSLIVDGDIKRDYQFIWQLYDIRLTQSAWSNGVRDYFDEVMGDNDVYNEDRFDYVSHLAQKVNLPTNNITELTEYNYGEIDTVIPYGRKYADIQVSYLDDSYDTVYNFHYRWLNACQRHKYPLYLFTTRAQYISYGVNDNNKFSTNTVDSYPRIYPKSISRTDANKSGSGFAGVTVTYGQLIVPKLEVRKL